MTRRRTSSPAAKRLLSRFRRHHRGNPPFLGFFESGLHDIYFVPTMERPNRIPYDTFDTFSLRLDENGGEAHFQFQILGCRHGLVLIFHMSMGWLFVWDPVTADQHIIALPKGLYPPYLPMNGPVVRDTVEPHHFQVVLVDIGEPKLHAPTRASALVYSSETRVWGNPISILVPPKPGFFINLIKDSINESFPTVLARNSLYWLRTISILEYDLDRQSLAVIPLPGDMLDFGISHYSVVRADGGGLGCMSLSKSSAKLWKWKTDCDGVALWVLGRTIELDKLLSLNSAEETSGLAIRGFAEDNNVVCLWTAIGHFKLHLGSLQFKKLFHTSIMACNHPFECVYTTGMDICSGRDGAELLPNA